MHRLYRDLLSKRADIPKNKHVKNIKAHSHFKTTIIPQLTNENHSKITKRLASNVLSVVLNLCKKLTCNKRV